MGLLGLVVSAGILLAGVPLLGPMVVVAAMPLVWAGFMLATRRTLTQQRITPAVLIEALRGPNHHRQGFAQLGLAYLLATLAVMQLAHVLGPGADVLGQVIEQSKSASEVMTHPDVQADLLWRMGLSLPVSLLFWHTPALLLWTRTPVHKALFFSAVASWRNLGAFVIYGAGWMLALTALVLLDRVVFSLLPDALSGLMAVASGLWLFSAFYGSLYFTVTDCFDQGEADTSPPATTIITPSDE